MFANVLSLAIFAGAAMAAPSPAVVNPNLQSISIAPYDKFVMMAMRSSSAIHFAHVSASMGSIFLNLPEQGATCDKVEMATAGSATFYVTEAGELYLYASSATPQQLYVDLSGMGQGKLGYTTGTQSLPLSAERGMFAINEFGDMTFNGANFIACPNSVQGSWSLWVDAGVANPGGNKDCLTLSARIVKVTGEPNSCVYSS